MILIQILLVNLFSIRLFLMKVYIKYEKAMYYILLRFLYVLIMVI